MNAVQTFTAYRTSLTSHEVLELGTRMNTRNHHLNGPHKKYLAGKEFAADTDMKQAVTSCLQTLGTVFLYTGIQVLVPRWDKRLNVNSTYTEVSCVSSPTYMSCVH
jgi:hypothetical protein